LNASRSGATRLDDHSLVIASVWTSAKTLKALASTGTVNTFFTKKICVRRQRPLTLDKPYDPI
jgi:hypothetical protein